jgi:hypothetical protein
VRRWILGLLLLASSAVADPRMTLGFDTFVIHRPIDSHQVDSVGNINSALDISLTRELTHGLYAGGEAGLMHVGAIAGVRWISGQTSGVVLAAEARAAEEALSGPAAYGRVTAGWVSADGLILAPALEAGRCWTTMGTSMTRTGVDVIGGTFEVGYRW